MLQAIFLLMATSAQKGSLSHPDTNLENHEKDETVKKEDA